MKSTPPLHPSSVLGADWFEKCANYLNDAILITEAEPIDLPGPRIIWANDVFYKQTGYVSEEIIGQSPRILQGPLSDKAALKRLREALKNWDVCRIEIINYKKDGTPFWNEFEVTPIADENGWYTHWIAVQRDITERKQLEATIVENEQRYTHAIEGANVGVWDFQIKTQSVYCSPIWRSMLGYDKSEATFALQSFVNMLHPGDREKVLIDLNAFISGSSAHYEQEFRLKHKLGHYVDIHSNAAAVKNEAGEIIRVVGTHVDISKRKRAEAKLTYQSSHDALTGLVNRREFERRAERLLTAAANENSAHALCYIDLDQFKVVNDTCGHAAGDELLRQLGVSLKKMVRKGDTLARLGGDEFGVLINNIDIDDARELAGSLRAAIEDFQYIYQTHSFRISASMGLVPIVDAQTTLTELLKNADAACYMAKDYGRNRIHVYSSSDEELTQRHGEMQWVNRIQHALREKRFCLYAQNIESLKGSEKAHYELLIRMKDTDGAIIPPGAFLPAAERYNLSVQLDKWVIEETFRLLFLHPSFLESVNFISINLSGHSLTDTGVLAFITAKFNQYNFDASKFCFEITETAAIANIVQAEKFIKELKALGCKFALDDFGSGLSSFAYLKSLPVDYLKIDGMFVKDMIDDKIDYAMVKAINDIGKIMQMQTIAEFVENNDIKNALSEIGVDYAQGYGVHKPQPFEDIINTQHVTRR